MTVPSHLSDRMPAVARAVGSWTVEDEAHLSRCEDCRAEWDVVQLGATVGLDVAAGLDVDRVAALVMADRVRRTPTPKALPLRRASWLVVTAAAAALMIAVLRPSPEPVADSAVASLLLPELERLSADELEYVLDVLPATDGWSIPGVGLGDLTAEELERVLGTLEG